MSRSVIPPCPVPRFDVRLMTTGRMKGQAFVGLPSEEVAARALSHTNGYQLAGRPMVVVGTCSSLPLGLSHLLLTSDL